MNSISDGGIPAQVYDDNYYGSMCSGHAEFLKGQVHPRYSEALAKAGALPAHSLVLDLGTGRGEIAILCARAGHRVWAVDYASTSLQIAQQAIKTSLEGDRARVAVGAMDATSLGLPSNSVDGMFMLEVVEHLYPAQTQKTLDEVFRVLKPDGTLVLSTGPNALLIQPLYFLSEKLFRMRWRSRQFHVNEQSYWSLCRAFSQQPCQFRVEVENTPNWFYGQIVENSNVPRWIKDPVKKFQVLWDSRICGWLRKCSPLRELLAQDFWVIARKV